MTLTAADVAEIMRLVEQSSFDELTLEWNGLKLALRRGAAAERLNGTTAPERTLSTGATEAAPAIPTGVNVPRSNAGAGTVSTAAPLPASNAAAGSVGAAAVSQAAGASSVQTAPATGSVGAAAARVPPQAPQTARADPNVHEVTSPLLGTFYRAPKPGAPPFVEVGSTVEEDTVVAIIEVMKLMNSVRAGARGTVLEILARDGALVEYGETVLRVRKAD